MENRKRNEMVVDRDGGARVDKCDFPGGGGGVGEEATQYPKIYNIFFCDISLLIVTSNRLVSHLAIT